MNVSKLHGLIDGKNITKAYILKETGITRPTLDFILEGKDFKVSNLEKIAKALKVPVGYFFDEDIKVEEYHSYGEKSISAKNIKQINQDANSNANQNIELINNLRLQIDKLQKELLDARAEIIELMKEKLS